MDSSRQNTPMTNDDEKIPASFEEITGISEERMRELEEMSAQATAARERLNLVPPNAGGEQYIRDRYPIAALFERADLQDIAESDFDEMLTETEIQDVAAAFFDDFPHEVHEALTNAIEYVLNQRKNYDVQDKSQGNT